MKGMLSLRLKHRPWVFSHHLSLTQWAAGPVALALRGPGCRVGQGLAVGALLPSAAQTRRLSGVGLPRKSSHRRAAPGSWMCGVGGARAPMPVILPHTDS